LPKPKKRMRYCCSIIRVFKIQNDKKIFLISQLFLLFWDRISICSQTWPQIWDPPCLAFQVLGFQVYVRHHSWLTIANFKCTQWYYSYVSIVTSLSWATYKAWEVDEVEVMVGWETSTLKIKNPTQPKQPPRVLVCDICRSLMTLLW
jgi:hypothetical protein